MTKQACELVTGYTYHVTLASRRFLNPNQSILVYDNDVLQTSGYHIDGGCQIRFDAAPTTPITVTAYYYTPAEVTLVQNYTLNLESEVYETTSLGSSARTYMGSGIIGWNGSFERFYEDNTWDALVRSNATHMLIRCFTDQPSGYCWQGWIVLGTWSQSTSQDGLETETITFTGYEKPVYSTDET